MRHCPHGIGLIDRCARCAPADQARPLTDEEAKARAEAEHLRERALLEAMDELEAATVEHQRTQAELEQVLDRRNKARRALRDLIRNGRPGDVTVEKVSGALRDVYGAR